MSDDRYLKIVDAKYPAQRGGCFEKATTTDAWLMGHIRLQSFPLYHNIHAFQHLAPDGAFVQ